MDLKYGDIIFVSDSRPKIKDRSFQHADVIVKQTTWC